MAGAIIVVAPGDAVSFETSSERFPVYLKDSGYNTNPNFDDGVFETLKTKITGSGLKISAFAFTFKTEGVYQFGDNADPSATTLVYVTNEHNSTIIPMTKKNLQRLELAPKAPEMQVLSAGLFAIGPFWIAAALALLLVQNILELRI
jgi:hypothetical protein